MSFSQVPPTPPTGLNAEAARLRQRQLDDRAAQTGYVRSTAPDGLHSMVARVRTALRAHRDVGRSSR